MSPSYSSWCARHRCRATARESKVSHSVLECVLREAVLWLGLTLGIARRASFAPSGCIDALLGRTAHVSPGPQLLDKLMAALGRGPDTGTARQRAWKRAPGSTASASAPALPAASCRQDSSREITLLAVELRQAALNLRTVHPAASGDVLTGNDGGCQLLRATLSALCPMRRRATDPITAIPSSSIAQVPGSGSGTAGRWSGPDRLNQIRSVPSPAVGQRRS